MNKAELINVVAEKAGLSMAFDRLDVRILDNK